MNSPTIKIWLKLILKLKKKKKIFVPFQNQFQETLDRIS